MLRVGVIGCGWITEKAHIPAIQGIDGASIESVCDSDKERMEYISEKFGIIHRFDDVNKFLESDIDAVIIASPNSTHSFYSDMALNANKHVLCEKPVALSASQYKKTLGIARKNNKIILPALVNRFRPDISKLNEIISSSNLGKLCKVEAAWIRKSGVPRPGTWITNKSLSGGGVLADLGSHIFDICLMNIENKENPQITLRNVERHTNSTSAVWCEYNKKEAFQVDVESAVSGEIQFNNEVILDFDLSWDRDVKGDYTTFKFIYEKGSISLHTLFGFSNNPLYDSIHICSDDREIIKMDIKSGYADIAFNRQAEYFVNSVSTNKTDYLSPIDGYYTVDIIERIYSMIMGDVC